jgi:uncharacterized protein YegP (UPF0339 family)
MSDERAKLQERLGKYEAQLKSLNSYVKELTDKASEHSTEREQFAEDLMEAEHNIKFYESEAARLRELIENETGSASYLVYEDSSGEWRWHLRAANNRIIADSGEGYRDKQDCLHAIELVKNSKDAPVKEKG